MASIHFEPADAAKREGAVIDAMQKGFGGVFPTDVLPLTKGEDLDPNDKSIPGTSKASVFVDYGPLGVAMIPAMTFLVAQRGYGGAAAAGPLGLAANLYPSAPYLELPDLAALLATPVLMFSLWAKVRLPRLPTQAFYAFYPAHLLALHVYDLYG